MRGRPGEGWQWLWAKPVALKATGGAWRWGRSGLQWARACGELSSPPPPWHLVLTRPASSAGTERLLAGGAPPSLGSVCSSCCTAVGPSGSIGESLGAPCLILHLERLCRSVFRLTHSARRGPFSC